MLLALAIKVHLVEVVSLSSCSEHSVTLTDLLKALQVALLLLSLNGLTQLITVCACLIRPGNPLILKLSLENFSLTLDDGAPFIDVAGSSDRVVPITLGSEGFH